MMRRGGIRGTGLNGAGGSPDCSAAAGGKVDAWRRPGIGSEELRLHPEPLLDAVNARG